MLRALNADGTKVPHDDAGNPVYGEAKVEVVKTEEAKIEETKIEGDDVGDDKSEGKKGKDKKSAKGTKED